MFFQQGTNVPGGVMRLGSDSPFYAWLKLDRLQGKVIPITTANVATADGDSLRPFFGYVLPPPIFLPLQSATGGADSP